jgi:uncharacterized UPF0160 family protein
MSKPRVITHGGNFHADDIFAVAALSLMLGDIEIVRTRDSKVIETGDYVVDVGGEYNPEKNRFDHHQVGGAGLRPDGIPYSSMGLVWKKYGVKISGDKEVADRINEDIVKTLDAHDNGIDTYLPREGIKPYLIQGALSMFRPTWKEDQHSYDDRFMIVFEIAKKILSREIVHTRDDLETERSVEIAYRQASDKRIIDIDKPYPAENFLSRYPEPLYVVRPSPVDGTWKVEAIRVTPQGFAIRKPFPSSWAGKRDGEFAELTDVPDAIFCHNGLWMARAQSHEGALKLAKLALEA